MSTIINLAHSLKLKVMAKGVETEETQGFLFSEAMPDDLFETKFLTGLLPGDAGNLSFSHPFPNQTAH